MTDCSECFWCSQPYGYYPIVCFRTQPIKEYIDDEPTECKHFKQYKEQQKTELQKPWQIIKGGLYKCYTD